MANPITLQDLELRWRPLSDAEQIVADSLLDDALAIVYWRIPDLESRIATDPTLTPILRQVITTAVKRAMLNPEGWRQESESFGSRSLSKTRDNSVAAGALFILPEELDGLYDAGVRGKAFSIAPGGWDAA